MRTERDARYLSRLAEFVRAEYGLSADSIVPAKRGYYGETWRLKADNADCFLKLDDSPTHQRKLQNCLPVMEHLRERGIDFIGRIVRTVRGDLSARFDGAVLAAFDWIEGENVESDDTKIPEYRMLGRIYPLSRPGFDIPSVAFADEQARRVYASWRRLGEHPSAGKNASVLAVLERNRERLERYSARLTTFSARCDRDRPPFYVTHGDAGGNLLFGNGRYHIVDWDEVMYAPLERDAWVMCCRDWAMRAFTASLRDNGIAYDLRPDCLAFYVYHMFFLYLGEFLDDYERYGTMEDVERLFDGWMTERLETADLVP